MDLCMGIEPTTCCSAHSIWDFTHCSYPNYTLHIQISKGLRLLLIWKFLIVTVTCYPWG